MKHEISNKDDVIDSRDIIERLAELSAIHDEQNGQFEDTDDLYEFLALSKLAEQGADYSDDWEYGATLIRDSYFKTYAMELAEDCGMINHDIAWPYTCIDWERAARDLRSDYTAIEFDGVTYWVR